VEKLVIALWWITAFCFFITLVLNVFGKAVLDWYFDKFHDYRHYE